MLSGKTLIIVYQNKLTILINNCLKAQYNIKSTIEVYKINLATNAPLFTNCEIHHLDFITVLPYHSWTITTPPLLLNGEKVITIN